eukprot:5446808-Pleurochrysis_carterae.AAC.2
MVCSRARRGVSPERSFARKTAEVRSPTPTGGRSKCSIGHATCQAPLCLQTRSISNSPLALRPAWARCFTRTICARPAPIKWWAA